MSKNVQSKQKSYQEKQLNENGLNKISSQHKKIIVPLYIIGITFILIATFNFSYLLPKIDDELSNKRREVEELQLTLSKIDWTDFSAKLSSFTISILKEINRKSISIPFLEKHLLVDDTVVLLYLHEALFGEQAGKELLEKWTKMNHIQLQEEKRRLIEKSSRKKLSFVGNMPATGKPERFLRLASELDSLNESKSNILFWTVLLQVFGLAINQFAVIIHIVKGVTH